MTSAAVGGNSDRYIAFGVIHRVLIPAEINLKVENLTNRIEHLMNCFYQERREKTPAFFKVFPISPAPELTIQSLLSRILEQNSAALRFS